MVAVAVARARVCRRLRLRLPASLQGHETQVGRARDANRTRADRARARDIATGAARFSKRRARARTPMPDAIVVGSGPGGSACARALAVAGKEVLLLERGDTVACSACCGEYSGAAYLCRVLHGLRRHPAPTSAPAPARAGTGAFFLVLFL